MNDASRVGDHERVAPASTGEAGPFTVIFADESSQTKHRYLAMGALVVPLAALGDLERDLRWAKLPELPSGEMAWTKVSKAKLPAYKRVVDAFFACSPFPNRTEFHSLYVDTHQIRDSKYNDGSREIGFNKEVYQLCRKVGRLHSKRLFHVYLDNRSTKSTTEHLRYMLNCDAIRTSPRRDWPFRRVHFRESCDCICIQLVDVLLGSVAFRLNGFRDLPGASPAKCELSDYIRDRAPYRDALVGTNREGRFTIWPRKLR